MSTVIYSPYIRPYQVLPLQAIVELGVMAIKGIGYPPKLQLYWSLTIRFLVSYLGHSFGWGFLNPLKGCNWCILHPQPTGLTVVWIIKIYLISILILYEGKSKNDNLISILILYEGKSKNDNLISILILYEVKSKNNAFL